MAEAELYVPYLSSCKAEGKSINVGPSGKIVGILFLRTCSSGPLWHPVTALPDRPIMSIGEKSRWEECLGDDR